MRIRNAVAIKGGCGRENFVDEPPREEHEKVLMWFDFERVVEGWLGKIRGRCVTRPIATRIEEAETAGALRNANVVDAANEAVLRIVRLVHGRRSVHGRPEDAVGIKGLRRELLRGRPCEAVYLVPQRTGGEYASGRDLICVRKSW